MAKASGHAIGQLIGNVLEAAVKPYLEGIAAKHDLYLDFHGSRPGVREGVKLNWTDDLGNSHDLDFVFERGGTQGHQGQPAAFIEAAWRRYKKHSKNKAQEIQGAVLPLLAKWENVKPAAAAIVAGEWSAPSLQQLRSSGFVVLHLHFPTTVSSFRRFGIDIEGKGEETDDSFWQAQADKYLAMSDTEKAQLAAALRSDHTESFDQFAVELERQMIRAVEYVQVIPLHGHSYRFEAVEDAIAHVASYEQTDVAAPFIRFEVRIAYTNGDKIDASFAEAIDACKFLETFA